jgi:ADP-ribosyl-[dinitrogen reductase] hydrolase
MANETDAPDAARRDRALGATIEFRRRDSYEPIQDMIGGGPFGLKPGEWTDDTSMALCLADSLLANGGALDSVDLALRFVRWWREGENSVRGTCFDIGGATQSALFFFEQTGVPRGSDHARSAGNGGIMRLAPVAVAARGDAVKAAALARAQSEVTHATLECLDAAEALAQILAAGITGEGVSALSAGARANLAVAKVKAIAEGAFRGKGRADIRSTGYVVDTLEAALWAVSKSESFEEAVLKAVNLGDADTVGAVAGQIAGAVWGLRGIPERWRRKLAWSDRLTETADALWRTAE